MRKAVVVFAASVVVLVGLVLTLRGTHTPDLTLLQVGAVILVVVALYSLIPPHEKSTLRVQTIPLGPPQPDASPDDPLATAVSPLLSMTSDAHPVPSGSGAGLEPERGRVTISGEVSHRSGANLAGVSVTAIDVASQKAVRSLTDPAGRFELQDLTGGSYCLVFLSPLLRPAVRSVMLAAGWAVVDVQLHGRGSVSSRVLGGSNRRPQIGVPVALARPDGTIGHTMLTDWTGRFLFADVDEGEWLVLTGAPGHRDGRQPVSVRTGEVAGEDVLLTALGEVTGEVSDAGDRIPSVPVALVAENGGVVDKTRTDRSGSYRFFDVAEGTYAVVALMVEPRTSVAIVRDPQHATA